MNFKKFISGFSALTIAASAFAGLAVTANAADVVDEVLLGTRTNATTVAAETFDDGDTAIANWSNKASFETTSDLPTDVWSSLPLSMSGTVMRLGSRSAHELDFANVVTSGKVTFSSDFYVGTNVKTIKFIDANDKEVASLKFADKNNNQRTYKEQYLFKGDTYSDAILGGSYVLADTYQ